MKWDKPSRPSSGIVDPVQVNRRDQTQGHVALTLGTTPLSKQESGHPILMCDCSKMEGVAKLQLGSAVALGLTQVLLFVNEYIQGYK